MGLYKTSDPSNGMLKLLDVIRADGVHLDPNNFWVAEGLDANYQKTYTLHLLDYRADAAVTGSYTFVYSKPADDAIPPTTTIVFDGASKGTNPVYITPQTKIIFTASDNEGGSGVEQMLRKVVGKDNSFVPALPMNIETTGNVALEYYSIDRAGNQEAARARICTLTMPPRALSHSRQRLLRSCLMRRRGAAAARTTDFILKASDEMSSLDAVIEIAKGSVFQRRI